MKKILEGFVYGILGAITLIMIGGGIVGIINIAMGLFDKGPGFSVIFLLGIIGFLIGVYNYLDLNERKTKENGINKLIELLNESEDGFVSKFVSYDDMNGVFRLNSGQSFHYTLILSKEYCFIKRLVENDKIDLEKLDEAERKPQYTFIDDDGRLGFKLFEVYESLLMLLSIQDEPISFLISILK